MERIILPDKAFVDDFLLLAGSHVGNDAILLVEAEFVFRWYIVTGIHVHVNVAVTITEGAVHWVSIKVDCG